MHTEAAKSALQRAREKSDAILSDLSVAISEQVSGSASARKLSLAAEMQRLFFELIDSELELTVVPLAASSTQDANVDVLTEEAAREQALKVSSSGRQVKRVELSAADAMAAQIPADEPALVPEATEHHASCICPRCNARRGLEVAHVGP